MRIRPLHRRRGVVVWVHKHHASDACLACVGHALCSTFLQDGMMKDEWHLHPLPSSILRHEPSPRAQARSRRPLARDPCTFTMRLRHISTSFAATFPFLRAQLHHTIVQLFHPPVFSSLPLSMKRGWWFHPLGCTCCCHFTCSAPLTTLHVVEGSVPAATRQRMDDTCDLPTAWT